MANNPENVSIWWRHHEQLRRPEIFLLLLDYVFLFFIHSTKPQAEHISITNGPIVAI